MSLSNQEILAAMRAMAEGKSNGKKLKINPKTKRIELAECSDKDPDGYTQISPSDAEMFFSIH